MQSSRGNGKPSPEAVLEWMRRKGLATPAPPPDPGEAYPLEPWNDPEAARSFD